MRISYLSFLSIAAVVAASTGVPAAAQSLRVRGVLEQADAAHVTVKSREGNSVTLALPDPPRISAVVRASLADVKPGTFIGATSLPMPDGTQRAVAIAILPESARASGGFHSAWDLLPESTMTNATVAEAAGKVDGETLKVTYKDGEKTILVAPDTPVVGFGPATRDDLRPGTRVVVFATKRDDGSLLAGNVVVGKDGVDPPM